MIKEIKEIINEIESVKNEIESVKNEIEDDYKKYKEQSDVDKGWVEGLEYALGIINRKLVFKKEKHNVGFKDHEKDE